MKKFNFTKALILLFPLLVCISWIYVLKIEGADILSVFTEKNLIHTKKFLSGMIGLGEAKPAFLDKMIIKDTLKLTLETLQMSIMAIGFSTIGMFLTVISASRRVADGSLTMKKSWLGLIIYYITKTVYLFSRAIPELIWAMIVIFVFKPGILPGAIALSLHNFGILGKLCAEVIDNIDLRPIRNLASSGANSVQIFFYGVIPTVLPKFMTYIVYRLEIIMRTTIVVGFIGAGGLGTQFRLSMSFVRYSELTLILICYVFLVLIADVVSELTRRLSN